MLIVAVHYKHILDVINCFFMVIFMQHKEPHFWTKTSQRQMFPKAVAYLNRQLISRSGTQSACEGGKSPLIGCSCCNLCFCL